MVINEQFTLSELNGNGFTLPLHACFHNTEYFYLETVSAQVMSLAPLFFTHDIDRITFLGVICNTCRH